VFCELWQSCWKMNSPESWCMARSILSTKWYANCLTISIDWECYKYSLYFNFVKRNDVTHFTDWGLTSFLTSVFHKAVWQHAWGEVGYLMTALLQISRRMCRWKNYENRTVFDEVMCRLIWLTFFGPPCICTICTTGVSSCGLWQYCALQIDSHALVRGCHLTIFQNLS